MHQETHEGLRAIVEKYRGGDRNPHTIGAIEVLLRVAEAERLLEEAGRAAPLPAQHARVHAMGHAEYLGPVSAVGRGYRVEHHEVDGANAFGPAVIAKRIVDVFAVHSVEYLSSDEWAYELHKLDEAVARSNREHRERTTLPDGYELITINGDHGYQRPDGSQKTSDYWSDYWSVQDARHHAWFDAKRREAAAAETHDDDLVYDVIDTRTPKNWPGPDVRCPGCQVRIVDAGGEAPTAVLLTVDRDPQISHDTWVCSNCYDADRWPVARLDRKEPPPGWRIAEIGGEVYEIGDPEGHTDLDGAWASRQRRNDPPGMFVERVGEGPDGPLFAFRIGSGEHDATHHATIEAARDAAWTHYWPRAEVVELLIDEDARRVFEKVDDGSPLPGDLPWPLALTWSDEQVTKIREMLEVLRG